MSYSTYWSYLYSVALHNLRLAGVCALGPGRPDPVKGVYAQSHFLVKSEPHYGMTQSQSWLIVGFCSL